MPKTTLRLDSCANTQTFALSQNTGVSHVPKTVLSFGMKKQRKYQHTTRHAKHAWARLHTRNGNEDHHSKRGRGNMTLIITATKATTMEVLLSLHKGATT